MSVRVRAISAVTGFLIAGLMGCNSKDAGSPDAGTGSNSAPPQGTLRDSDGHPVAGAEIRVFPVGYLPLPGDALAKGAAEGSQAFLTHSDADGHYSLPSVAPGLYNLLAISGDEACLRDSVFLPAKSDLSDTLRAAASLTGRVEVQPGDDPRGFAVQVEGLPYRVWLDTNGNFTLARLPAGYLRLRIAREGSADYQEGNLNVTLSQGSAKELDEPIALVYLKIPAVRDLRVVMDTVTGIAELTWSRPLSPLIDHYVVIREGSTSNPYNPYWITVEDTVFRDTLFPALRTTTIPGGSTGVGTLPFDSTIVKVQYRVAAAGRDDLTGPFAEKMKVESPAPWTVSTVFAIGDDSLPRIYLQAGSKGNLGVSFANPSRKITKLEWKDSKGNVLRTAAFNVKKGRDSLEVDVPAVGDSMQVGLEATDASGHIWKDSLMVFGAPWKRLADRPIPVYGQVGSFHVDEPMLAMDGKIYAFGSHGAESQTASTVFDPATGEWTAIAEAPALGPVVETGGKAYLAAGDGLYAYSPGQDRWDSVAGLVHQSNIYGVRPLFLSDGKIAVGSSQADWKATYFDPGTGESSLFPDGYTAPFTIQFTTARRAYLQFPYYSYYSYYGLVSYKWASSALTNIPTDPYSVTNNPVELNGFHYFVNAGGSMSVFDEDRETFQTRVGPGFSGLDNYPYPYPSSLQVDVHILGGRIYAFCLTHPGLVEVKSYLPGDRQWKSEIPISIQGNQFTTTETGGTVYLLGFYGKGDPRSDGKPAFYAYRP